MKHLFFGVAFVVVGLSISIMPAVVLAQQTTTSSIISDQAYKLIQEARSTMSLIDTKLSELADLGSLPVGEGITMQVSLAEISGKVQVSRQLLDQALTAYANQDYTKAAILAFRSKQNTLLTTLYLEGLMNKAQSSLGISRLELQGSFAELLRLRNLLSVVTPTPDPTPTPTDPDTNPPDDPTPTDPDQPENPDTPDTPPNPDPDDQDTATSTPPEEPPPPVVVPTNPKVQACIDKGLVSCNNQQVICSDRAKQITSRCQVNFDAGVTSCKRYEARAETYLVKCQANLTKCQATATTALRKTRCQAQFVTCEVRAGISKNRDLATANTCIAKQTTKKAACDLAYTNRVNTLLARCTSNFTACDTRVKTRCAALATPKPKVVQ